MARLTESKIESATSSTWCPFSDKEKMIFRGLAERVFNETKAGMPVCLAMGEAAGIAAKLAASDSDGNVHGVDVKKLRTRLKEEGGYLP